MKTKFFSINKQYEISCKISVPDDESFSNIIIGVHGFAGDKESSMLEKLAEAVCSHNTALICFDFPAHGNSVVDDKMLTVKNCKQDLLAVVEYIAQTYPNANKSIFATSFGGYISLLCADKLAEIPMVLRAPAVTMPKVLIENVLEISAEEFMTMETVKCGFERPIILPYSFYEDLLSQEKIGSKHISSPTLVIHGDSDDIVPLADVEVFVSSQDNASLHIIHGADHRFKKAGEMEIIVKLTKDFLHI